MLQHCLWGKFNSKNQYIYILILDKRIKSTNLNTSLTNLNTSLNKQTMLFYYQTVYSFCLVHKNFASKIFSNFLLVLIELNI